MRTGDLADAGLSVLLGQLCDAAATGCLSVDSPASAPVKVFLRSGLVYAAATAGRPHRTTRQPIHETLVDLLAQTRGSWQFEPGAEFEAIDETGRGDAAGPINAAGHGDPDITALLRELSSLGVDEDSGTARPGPRTVTSPAVPQPRRKGLFGR